MYWGDVRRGKSCEMLMRQRQFAGVGYDEDRTSQAGISWKQGKVGYFLAECRWTKSADRRGRVS